MMKHETLFKQKRDVLKTVPGLGDIISTNLLAFMPELGVADRRQIASLGGVAPHPNESGKKIGYRCTRGGRANVKRMLFMAAMTASRSNSKLGEFYQRLVAAGKKKMVALTALMPKILVIANARLIDFYLEIEQATT
jgi:transposase